MHPNLAFRQTPEARNIDFAREQGFGILAVGTDAAPLMSHIPFLLSDDGNMAEFHLVRSNPIVRRMSEPLQARLAVSGPHSCVSPDWYEVDDQVPTWNYIAVHLVGEIERRPQDEMHNLLDRQSAHFEDQLLPKPPWMTAKMTPEVLGRMMRQIVPCRMRVDEIHGTWKLNQNKPDEVRLRAADQVQSADMGVQADMLARQMRDLP
ncbi:FMN-binding negative transcriptional regulator [Roseovarius phycicola]|uniref:FMN-binding negative transcriptional regulator n=1 Tax=Roseovarius phycicola TaxID=3080976 RepID=A0ABZ2HIN9_9RHOB